MGEDIPTIECKSDKDILEQKIWEQKDDNKNAEWINNIENELRILEGVQIEIQLDGKKKNTCRDVLHGFWF